MLIFLYNLYSGNFFLSFIIILLLLKGFAANYGLSYIVHQSIYKVVHNKNIESEIEVTSHRKRTRLKYLLSFDYYAADHFKNELSKVEENIEARKKKETVDKFEPSNIKRSLFINEANRINLIISLCILAFSVIILQPLLYNEITIFLILRFPLFVVFGGFVICRTISRSFEITFAFYSDIYEDDKNSALNNSDRLRLAVKSYFEIILNFTVVYFILDNFEKLVNCAFLSQQEIVSNIFDFIFYSFGVSTFTGVEFTGNSFLWNFFVLLQLLSSMCLVYFALAKYIGDRKEKVTEETVLSILKKLKEAEKNESKEDK